MFFLTPGLFPIVHPLSLCKLGCPCSSQARNSNISQFLRPFFPSHTSNLVRSLNVGGLTGQILVMSVTLRECTRIYFNLCEQAKQNRKIKKTSAKTASVYYGTETDVFHFFVFWSFPKKNPRPRRVRRGWADAPPARSWWRDPCPSWCPSWVELEVMVRPWWDHG